MKQTNLCLLLVLLFLSLTTVAQKKSPKKPAQKAVVTKTVVTKAVEEKKSDVVADEKKVRDIIAFLEYMLNTLGSSSTPIRDKEILITESYAKIFRDSKVQVEDDLDDERKVITNKDIVAYLKDVNFFFQDVRFEFTIESIKSNTLPNGQNFYSVATTRNLKGNTADRKPVNNTQPRYIEINYNPEDQDLKIVSIYTHEFDEKKVLVSWWKELSYEWQSIFRRKLNLSDSVSLNDLKAITSLEELDIGHNTYVQTLAPLSQLIRLTSLNLAGTTIHDLTPIRNLTELVSLDVSNTSVKELAPLKYSNKMERLIINHTYVADISVVEKMPALQHLEMSGTPVLDFTSLANLPALQVANLSATKLANLAPLKNLNHVQELNVSNTLIQDLEPLRGLKALHTLTIDSSGISDITPLSALDNLKILSANFTSIHDLTPLQKLQHLERIYCDQTTIKQAAADTFMAVNKKTLVIFDSEDLKTWWSTLSDDWRYILSQTATISDVPTKEELAKIPLLDSINIVEHLNINSLEPLRKLQKLQTIRINKSAIADLTPLHNHTEISYLDISETEIRDISMLQNFKNLKILKADNSKIENVDLLQLPELKIVYADRTSVHDIIAQEFLKKNPDCLLVYKTNALQRWWDNLSDTWKEVFRKQVEKEPGANRENLHQLVEQESFHFKNAPVTDLAALSEFIRLRELHFSETSITDIVPTNTLLSLKSLHATNSPLENIKSISVLTELEDLDISNTPVEDVSPLWKLKKLTRLNCAGTQLKRLDALEKLENLAHLDFSNTNVSRLNPLDYLPLKTLKCYNTKVSNRSLENFKASHPECEVVYYR